MIIERWSLMGRDGFCSRVLFITQEALLRLFLHNLVFLMYKLLGAFCANMELFLLLGVRFQVWPELIRKSKEGGLDVIETYVFWNYHEPVKGQV